MGLPERVFPWSPGRVRDDVACSCEQTYAPLRTEHVFSPHDALHECGRGCTTCCEVHLGGLMGCLGNNLG